MSVSVIDVEYMRSMGHDTQHPVTDLCSGDSTLFLDVFPPEVSSDAFNSLNNEISWSTMHHKGGAVPRLMCLQGTIVDDVIPLYRHPAEEQPELTPWTSFADMCRVRVSEILQQELNHALIQKYRNGYDYISEHADKTLDIARGTAIVNISFGATRVMILKTKPNVTEKKVYKIDLPHNSVFVLGWRSNLEYTHSIKQDKRQRSLKRPDEVLYSEQRISMTLRSVATYYNLKTGEVFGQGAKKADSDECESSEEERMLFAFSDENKNADFDWDRWYGKGFNILDLRNAAMHQSGSNTCITGMGGTPS